MAFRFNFGGPPAEPELEPEPEPGPRPAARRPAERVEAGVGAAGPSGAPGPALEWDRLELGGPAGPAGGALWRLRAPSAPPTVGGRALAATDLVAGVYEGGFKCWEGSLDLARLLLAADGPGEGRREGGEGHGDPPNPYSLGSGQRVLELGCGHGLPGVVALLRGAAVDFQDFNREVLEAATAPTVARNLGPGAGPAAGGRARYFAGDWAALTALLPAKAYDVVLTAETIYDVQASGALVDLVAHCLKPSGVALVAAKVFYFGVGGGVPEFTRRVARDPRFLAPETVAEFDDGASNMRKILALRPA